MEQCFQRAETARIVGIKSRRLDYWARIGLVVPQTRDGERVYSFSDLVALETVRRLTERRLPASHLRRAIAALESQLGSPPGPLSSLRVVTNGRQVALQLPGETAPIEPLTGQLLLAFDTSTIAEKIHAMARQGGRTAEEWFEIGLSADSSTDTLERAVEAYRKSSELSPKWVEPRINLGTALYQLGRLEESKACFLEAILIEPSNALGHFNLGCVLEQMGETEAALTHLERAVALVPSMADAHLNLALIAERLGQKEMARERLSLYLRYQPNGPWADFARTRLSAPTPHPRHGKVTPFRRKA